MEAREVGVCVYLGQAMNSRSWYLFSMDTFKLMEGFFFVQHVALLSDPARSRATYTYNHMLLGKRAVAPFFLSVSTLLHSTGVTNSRVLKKTGTL